MKIHHHHILKTQAWSICSLAIIALIGGIFLALPNGSASAKSNYNKDAYAENNIVWYNDTCTDYGSNDCYFDELTWADFDELDHNGWSAMLEANMKAYAQYAIQLQIEYGIPWEIYFVTIIHESGAGNEAYNSAAATYYMREDGYYNMAGMMGENPWSDGCYAFENYGSRCLAQYSSVSKSMAAWFISFWRNGYYDEALTYLNYDNYDLKNFLDVGIEVYSPVSDNCGYSFCPTDERYYNAGFQNPIAAEYYDMITGNLGYSSANLIAEYRDALGLPSSEEVAKNNQVSAGGKYDQTVYGGFHAGNHSDEVYQKYGDLGLANCGGGSGATTDETKLSNLHVLLQGWGGDVDGAKYAGKEMRPDGSAPGDTISNSGCGIMSLYAIYYMFSGQEEEAIFDDFLQATINDGYNCVVAGDGAQSCASAAAGSSDTSIYANFSLYIDNPISAMSWDDAVAILKEGKKILINVSVAYSNSYGTTKFTSGGHYMMLDHYDEERDMIYLFDPNRFAGNNYAYIQSSTSGSMELISGTSGEDGAYIDRQVYDDSVVVRTGWAVSYDGPTDSSNYCSGKNSSQSGVTSVEEGESEIMDLYRGLDGVIGPNNEWGITNEYASGGKYERNPYLENCTAFSKYFIAEYTDLKSVMANGNYFNTALLNANPDQNLKESTEPSVYSVASCGASDKWGHTFIVIGKDKQSGNYIIGESGYESGWDFIGAHLNDLTGSAGQAYSNCTFIDLSDHITKGDLP